MTNEEMTNEEALDELNVIYERLSHPENCEQGVYSFRDGDYLEALDMAIKALEQTRWIPVSERLPEEDGFYLATLDGEICGEDKPFSGLAEFENGKWVDDEEDYQCVIAWMPLPQPYKAEGEGEE